MVRSVAGLGCFLPNFYITCKQPNMFLASLPVKVWFGVWIDILVKEKFSN